jgi:hypothetical protein
MSAKSNAKNNKQVCMEFIYLDFVFYFIIRLKGLSIQRNFYHNIRGLRRLIKYREDWEQIATRKFCQIRMGFCLMAEFLSQTKMRPKLSDLKPLWQGIMQSYICSLGLQYMAACLQ